MTKEEYEGSKLVLCNGVKVDAERFIEGCVHSLSKTATGFKDVHAMTYLSRLNNDAERLSAFCRYSEPALRFRHECRKLGFHCSVFANDFHIYVICNKDKSIVADLKNYIMR